jgi:tetratricopeptide (TPR) repeat protein
LPDSEAFYPRMAQAFLAEGQLAEAVAIYRSAVQRYPRNADFHYALGSVLVDRLGASEEALGPFMMAVKHRPRFPEAMLALARVQYELGYFDEAIGQYRAVLDVDSSSAEALAGWGQSLAAKGDHKAAIEILERATRLPSADDAVWTALARSQAALGRSDVAAASLRRSVALNPESRDAFCLLAQVLTTAGKAEEARAACTQALRPTQHPGSECACTP